MGPTTFTGLGRKAGKKRRPRCLGTLSMRRRAFSRHLGPPKGWTRRRASGFRRKPCHGGCRLRERFTDGLRVEARYLSAEGRDRMSESIRIVALGDSITNGAGLVGVTEAQTFRQIVRRELGEKLGVTVEMINAGVNGDVVTLAIERLECDVLAHRPEIVTVMFGGNEAGFYRPETGGFADTPRVDRKEFAETLAKVVERLRAASVTVILMTCPPMTERYWGMHLEPYQKYGINFLVKQYAEAVRNVAAEKAIELVDVYRAFEQAPERLDYFPDGLHPDARGHRVIAELLVERLAQIITRRTTAGPKHPSSSSPSNARNPKYESRNP
ncbi:MAG TPA: hypothetical protein EYP56_10955 [Planctomycetaceae bacterium]|nr:hypothetical protein [Planctomycetaceae bacterium]